MATVNSRIPQGKPTRIPGGIGNSRLTNIPNRTRTSCTSSLKSSTVKGTVNTIHNNQPNGGTNDNYKLTFLKPPSKAVIDLEINKKDDFNENDSTSIAGRTYDTLTSEEKFEFTSFVESSFKPLNSDFSNESSEHLNTVNRSAASSPSDIEINVLSKKQSFLSNKNKSQTQVKVGLIQPPRKPTNPVVSRSATFTLKARDSAGSRAGGSRITLPPSHSHLSAANAMDYVKKLTSQDDSNSMQSSAGKDVSHRKEPVKNASCPPRPAGRAAANSDVTTNSQHKVPSYVVEKTPGQRLERRLQHGRFKTKLSDKNAKNVADAVHEAESKQGQLGKSISYRSKLLGNDTRRIGAGSPRIVRPVTRPPRRRPYNEGESPTIDVAQDIPCDEEVCNSPANRLAAACGIDEHRSEQQDLKGHVSLFNRNTSLPPDVATPMGLSKQPGDTALIQAEDKDQTPEIPTSPNNPDPGQADDAIIDLLPRESDRSTQALHDADFTSGQLGLQEKKALEQKYSAIERPGFHYPTTSSLHPTSLSVSSLGNEPLNPPTMFNPVDDNDDQKEFIDVSPTSPNSPSLSGWKSMGNPLDRPRPSPPVANATAFDAISTVRSSPLRSRAASDDICKFYEAAAAASSNGYLKSTLDELMKEYEAVRGTLEELYHCLSEEEKQKARLEDAVERLRGRNNMLTEEVNKMTRIMEFQLSPATKRRNSSNHSTKRSTKEAATQTEAGRFWSRSNFSDMQNKLAVAVNHLNKVKDHKYLADTFLLQAQEELDQFIDELDE